MHRLIAILLLAASTASADCPRPADVSAEMAQLIDKARAAPDSRAGQRVSAQMWQVWLRAPDETAQEILDAGMGRRNAYDFAGAYREFDRLADYCPEYAEGFNQRAYIEFLRKNYEAALADLDIALSLQPDHIAAQAGRGLTLMNLGRTAEARAQMLIAVENNPWLSEAGLLRPGAPLGPTDTEL